MVALSSGEAEYYAAMKGAREAMGVQSVYADIDLAVSITVHTDSSACLGICNRSGIGKIKHTEVVWMWLQGMARSGRIKLMKIKGIVHPADLMTKYLSKSAIDEHMHTMNMAYVDGRPSTMDVV